MLCQCQKPMPMPSERKCAKCGLPLALPGGSPFEEVVTEPIGMLPLPGSQWIAVDTAPIIKETLDVAAYLATLPEEERFRQMKAVNDQYGTWFVRRALVGVRLAGGGA